jgi:hypothetical protein
MCIRVYARYVADPNSTELLISSQLQLLSGHLSKSRGTDNLKFTHSQPTLLTSPAVDHVYIQTATESEQGQERSSVI